MQYAWNYSCKVFVHWKLKLPNFLIYSVSFCNLLQWFITFNETLFVNSEYYFQNSQILRDKVPKRFSHVKRKGDSADFQMNICVEIPNNHIAVLEYEHTVYLWNHYALKVKIIKPTREYYVTKAWFTLAHKRKHRDISMCRMAYLTPFSIPALLNQMVNKMVDASSAIFLLIC